MIYPPGAPGPSPPECPVHQAEGGVAEALHDGVDHMTKPHRPRSHTEVKEDTAVKSLRRSILWIVQLFLPNSVEQMQKRIFERYFVNQWKQKCPEEDSNEKTNAVGDCCEVPTCHFQESHLELLAILLLQEGNDGQAHVEKEVDHQHQHALIGQVYQPMRWKGGVWGPDVEIDRGVGEGEECSVAQEELGHCLYVTPLTNSKHFGILVRETNILQT